MKVSTALFMISFSLVSQSSYTMDYFKEMMAKKMLQEAVEQVKNDPTFKLMQHTHEFMSKKLELEEINEKDFFDFGTLDIKKIEEETKLDLSGWAIERCYDLDDEGKKLSKSLKAPLYFFDAKEKESLGKEFGICEYKFFEGDENAESAIKLETFRVEEKYRDSDLNKLVWVKLLPYLIKTHGEFKTIKIDVCLPYGKENKQKKSNEELRFNVHAYFKSLGAAMYKNSVDDGKGILYVEKLQELLKKYKEN